MTINTSTLGGKTIFDPPRPDAVNWFSSGTGAGKYGHGVFLLRSEDYTALAATAGTVPLVIRDHRGKDGGVTLNVYVASAMPYMTGSGSVPGVVAVRVYDKRYTQDRAVTAAFNVQAPNFPYDSSTPKFRRDSLSGGIEWTWANAMTSLEFPSIPDAPSWKPRNVVIDAWHLHRGIDWVASELFLVVGWTDSSAAFSYHAPGVMTDANALIKKRAAGLLVAGGEGFRNTKRLPKIFAAKFKQAATVHVDDVRFYTKNTTVNADGVSTQPLHVGGYIATRSASSWLESSTLDAVAADLSARAYAFISVAPSMHTYAGIIPFTPDGAIREILWQSGPQGATTRIMQGCRFDWSQSANGGLWGFADPSIPGAQPRLELPSDQLIVGLSGTNSSVGPSGTRYVWGGPPMVRVYITAAASGGGKYDGKILPEPATAPAATGDLAQADLGGTAGTECLVLNMQEVGAGATHWLTHEDNTNEKTFLGMLDGATSGGVPIVYINGFWGGACVTEE